MCLFPRKIINPTKLISLQGGQPLYIEVPCGHCAQCKKNKRLEWRFRSYYQSLDTIKKGGYVYFDTLTYSEEFVPRISNFVKCDDSHDFTCFNHTHWVNFLKNLRRQLEYHYKGIEVKYFMTSEYGLDDRYTHRPHYHSLFFVTGTLANGEIIHPFTFSRLVSKCWKYGRTDGIQYKKGKHVAEHVYGYELGYEVSDNILKLCNYVAKYVTKDSTFQETLNKRKEYLRTLINDDEEYNKLIRNIDMCHRQNEGYGLSFISNLSKDEYKYIYHNRKVSVKDGDKVVFALRLPLYYERKLFYQSLKDADGKYYWQLTNKGKEYKFNSMLKSIENVTKLYENILLNTRDSRVKELVYRLFRDRSLQDFVIYKLFYQGRCRYLYSDVLHPFNVKYAPLNDVESNLYDWFNSIVESACPRKLLVNQVYKRDDFNNIYVIQSYGDLFNEHSEQLVLNYNEFLKSITYDEHTCFAFRDFDLLDSLFKHLMNVDNKIDQSTFEFIEELTSKLQIIYYE